MKISCKYNKELNKNKLIQALYHNRAENFIEEQTIKDIDEIYTNQGFPAVIEYIYNKYPLYTPQLIRITSAISQQVLFPIQGDEYSLAIRRENPFSIDYEDNVFDLIDNDDFDDEFCDTGSLAWIPRYVSEFNPHFIQVSVGVYIHNKAKDRFIFLKCITGNFENQYTLVQGHAAYDRNFAVNDESDGIFSSLHDLIMYLKIQAFKELQEECNFNSESNKFDIVNLSDEYIRIPVCSDSLSNITHYHCGVIFGYELDDELFEHVVSGEPDKHVVEIVDREKIKDLLDNPDLTDDWLNITLQYI